MKAVYAEENFKIGLRDIPVPEIRPDEVLIRMTLRESAVRICMPTGGCMPFGNLL